VARILRPTASDTDDGNPPGDTGGHCPPATEKTRNSRLAPRAGRPPTGPNSIRRRHRTAPAEAPRSCRRRRRPPGAVRPRAEGVSAPDFPLRQGGSAPRGIRAAVVAARIGRQEDLPPVGVTTPADDDGGRRRRASSAGGKTAADWAVFDPAAPPQKTENLATAPPRPRATPAEAPRRCRRRRRPPGAVGPHAESVAAFDFVLRQGGRAPRGARAAVVAARIGRREDLLPSASPRPLTTTGAGEDARAPRFGVAVSDPRCRRLSRPRCPGHASRRHVHDPSRAGRCLSISTRPRGQVRRHACGRGRDCRLYLKSAEEEGDADHRHWRRRV